MLSSCSFSLFYFQTAQIRLFESRNAQQTASCRGGLADLLGYVVFGSTLVRNMKSVRALLFYLWGEMREHLLHSLVEIPGVLVSIVGKCVAGRASPDQGPGLGVEQIDDQGSDLVGFGCRRCVSEPSESSPTPTSSKVVVKSVKSLLISRHLHRYESHIATRIHLCPALGC